MIGLVDCNNFYVSCERVFNLDLKGKPVGILSNNDGCVVSRSNELKSLGIKMGTPAFELRPLLNNKEIILKSSNYELYADFSRRVMTLLTEFSPEVEQYSIDEAFIYPALNESATTQEYLDLGKKIRNAALNWIGIPVGIGFAPTKTLAKLANHIAKSSSDGVFVFPTQTNEIFQNLSIDEVWGIGRQTKVKLNLMGIYTIAQLLNLKEEPLRKKFNINLLRTIRELKGIPSIQEGPPEDPAQSITCSRCFGAPVTEYNAMRESIVNYLSTATLKLRKQGLKASGVTLYFQYYPEYDPLSLPGGTSSIPVLFRPPCDNVFEMMESINDILPSLFLEKRRYKKSGVILFGLESKHGEQLTLFDHDDQAHIPTTIKHTSSSYKKKQEISTLMDQINQKYGKNTLFPLSQGIKKSWSMKRDMLSQSYTTNWDELLLVD